MAAHRSSDVRPGRRRLGAVLTVLLIALAGLGALGVLSGKYQLRPVLSGSMRPGLAVGGLVITERVPVSSLRVRDVVVFHRPDRPEELVVHRIISLTRGPDGLVVRTQGDANDTPDPWQATLRGATAYRARYSLPLLGYPVVWAHSPTGRLIFLLTGTLLVVGAAGTGLISRRRRPTDAAALPAPVPDAAARARVPAAIGLVDAERTEHEA